MGKIRLEILEENFSKYTTNQYRLSILIGMDSLSYIVTNAQAEVLLLRECALTETPLADFLLQDEYLRLSYQSTQVALSSSIFTFLPTRLYNISEKKSYLQHVASISADIEVRADELKEINAVNVYGIPKSTFDTLHKFAGGSHIFHTATALITNLLKRKNNSRNLYMHVHEGSVTVVLLEGKSLLFVNTFSYVSAKDFVYYVMLVFEQFKLAPEEVPAYISGKILEESEVYAMIHRYVPRLEFLPAPDFLKFSPRWNQHQPHFFADLFGLTQC